MVVLHRTRLGSLVLALALFGGAGTAQPSAGESPGPATRGPTRIFAENWDVEIPRKLV